MWQGESHKDGPPADTRANSSMRLFAVVWTLISGGMFGFIIFTENGNTRMKGGAWAAVIACGILFVGIGIGLFVSTLRFRHEYYCITDKRFIRMNDKGVMQQQSDLSHILSAELTGMKNGYGSIAMKTDIVHHHHTNGHYHTNREYWKMQGVEQPAECFRMLTGILQINDEYRN